MCNCHSYNLDDPGAINKRPAALLYPPRHLFPVKSERGICVDFCIARVIQNLWYQNIVTMGCCCGHGERRPSIIFEDDQPMSFLNYVRSFIATIDDRKFSLHVWISKRTDEDGRKQDLHVSNDFDHLEKETWTK